MSEDPIPPSPVSASAKKRILASTTALPLGYKLHEFVIEGLVGEGGFGVVYYAWDTQLQCHRAIKEYIPAQLAQRMPDQSVQVRSQRHADTFALGLRSFVNEARLLAMFDHKSLLKVLRFFEANGTAYMVMPYYEGPTLKAWLVEHAQAPGEEWLKRMLRPLLDALELMHSQKCYHRDIAPDNILLLTGKGDQPLLLDFGAARRVIGDATQALTVILKPGYAPIEQYAEVASLKQGPWTDVYALSAVLYASITITAPIPSVGRMIKDELPPAAVVAAGRYSEAFLHAIDAGLAVRPEDRPQSIADLRRLLFPEQFVYSGPAPLDQVTGVSRELDADSTISRFPGSTSLTGSMPLDEVPSPNPAMNTASSPAAPVAASHPGRRAADREPAINPDVSSSQLASRLPRVVVPLVMAGVAVGAAWWFWSPPAGSGASGLPPVAQPSSAPVVVAAAQLPTASAPASSVIETPPPATTPARAPFGVVKALEDMVVQADPLFAVNTLPDQSPVVIDRDRLQFRVTSSRSGYLYVFLAGTDASHFYMLFPNKIDAKNRIQADRMQVLPRAGWHITAGGPPGINHIVTVVSTHPLDLSGTGLRQDGDLAEFDLIEARKLWDAHQGPGSPFLGKPQCSAPPCNASFGAAMVKIEEVAR